MRALKNVGARIEDYEKFYYGEFDPELLKFITSFFIAERLYATHVDDERQIEAENRRRIEAATAASKKKN